MEEEIEPYSINFLYWQLVGPAALPASVVEEVSRALVEASEPLIVTGYSGRNHAAVKSLESLANTVKGLRVLDTGGSDMCFPADYLGWLGMKYGVDESLKTANVLLILDCDVPWVNKFCKPKASSKIYHFNVDPLKQLMLVFYIDAQQRYRVDAETAITQIVSYLKSFLLEKLASKEMDR
ncbi:hypothetical protein SLS59_007207 [Nothophoma quercina]|uniref:Uncharacterized protein n=1 Tax=Nothophoma quercina TaxID=749835 RepID=A0ABR3R2J6_9PLEO